MNTNELIDEYALKLKDSNIYLAPNIPEKKIMGAIKSFAKDIDINEPLLLIDETLFGSGKDGLILTKNKIYAKASFEKPIYFELNKIKKVDSDNKFEAILLNGYEFVKLTMPSKNARVEFISLLRKLTQTKEGESISPETTQPFPSNTEANSNIKNLCASSTIKESFVPLTFAQKAGVFGLIVLLAVVTFSEFYLFKNYNTENKETLKLLLFGIPIGYGLPLAGVGIILGLRDKIAIFTSTSDVFLTGMACVVNIITFLVAEISFDTVFFYTSLIISITLNISFIICSYLANKSILFTFILIPTKFCCVLILLLLSAVTLGFAFALKENIENKEYKKALGNGARTVATGYSTILVDKFLHKLVKKGKEIKEQKNK